MYSKGVVRRFVQPKNHSIRIAVLGYPLLGVCGDVLFGTGQAASLRSRGWCHRRRWWES
ncbi:hypothetical protein COCCADRAFT_89923 [Bipolaris zeicola 26-R-13]|uniref:Uncharacterized protein n=1 Tax=Cochliobolus carbonum (strain 26-R-13) TaxID=930089 RepID=W6YJK0_COCC2|nr:uncharacterized protein COCCADRAFT_89923 [Bipolaris zeicola 26-R-13]EUC35759.1 hypothetical protein COCCADRAFT_89923 [Bipolaris zeicola 26-R-13]